jgi:hypothetical protein
MDKVRRLNPFKAADWLFGQQLGVNATDPAKIKDETLSRLGHWLALGKQWGPGAWLFVIARLLYLQLQATGAVNRSMRAFVLLMEQARDEAQAATGELRRVIRDPEAEADEVPDDDGAPSQAQIEAILRAHGIEGPVQLARPGESLTGPREDGEGAVA